MVPASTLLFTLPDRGHLEISIPASIAEAHAQTLGHGACLFGGIVVCLGRTVTVFFTDCVVLLLFAYLFEHRRAAVALLYVDRFLRFLSGVMAECG